MRWWSNFVTCRCQQAQRTWIRHSVPNHPQDRTLWIRGELPWHVLVFVQNITWINIFLCRSEYDPFIWVAGSCCADITAKYIRCPVRQKKIVFSDKNCCVHTVPVVFYLQGHLWYPHKRNILTSLPSDSRMDPNCHLHRYLDVIYARLPYMYFRVCSYQIHIFRDPGGVFKRMRLKLQRGENSYLLLKQSPEFLIPALQELRLEPKIMKCGDLLTSCILKWFVIKTGLGCLAWGNYSHNNCP